MLDNCCVGFVCADIYLIFLCNVGKGSYGAVYKARDLKTSELVAIKVISLVEGVSFLLLLPDSFLFLMLCRSY